MHPYFDERTMLCMNQVTGVHPWPHEENQKTAWFLPHIQSTLHSLITSPSVSIWQQPPEVLPNALMQQYHLASPSWKDLWQLNWEKQSAHKLTILAGSISWLENRPIPSTLFAIYGTQLTAYIVVLCNTDLNNMESMIQNYETKPGNIKH